MNEKYPFDKLRKPLRKLPDDTPGLMPDEKWEKMLRDHDNALTRPFTLREKTLGFLGGLVITVLLVGYALIVALR